MTDVTQEDRDRAAVHHGYGSWRDMTYWASGKDHDVVERTATLIAETRITNTARADAVDDKAEIERLRHALQDVVDPIRVLLRYAEAEGAKLSDAAYSIANDIGYVQGIARDALAATPVLRTGDKNENVEQVLRDAGDLLVMPDYSQLAHREMVKRLRDCLVRITGNKE